MPPPARTVSPDNDMVVSGLLLNEALAIQADLLGRLRESPDDPSLWRQTEKNEELVDRLIWGYRTAISRYLSRLARSQLFF
jgi:hypothetical protein